MKNKISPITRFSNVVEDYIRYRPGYPEEIISVLNDEINLTPRSVIADVGSGTGKSSKLFLSNNNVVYGIEPNDAMRNAAESEFKNFSNFISINATAENTGLPSHSVDIIVSGQAFHWFDQKAARKEFKRILKPVGWVVLIWNDRDNQTPFAQAYETFVRAYSTDYVQVNHRNVDVPEIRDFFEPNSCSRMELNHFQEFDFDGLRGRHLSASYAYKQDHPAFDASMKKLREIFDQYQEGGFVKMEYITKLYFGQLSYVLRES
ncbi:MAG TPA: class I SAM-dependent methyltransferase [Cyclobacteriaceae bacterium]|nr:class I SAM-dependent methyltransferase [Cyclobacteriaceae bacterium]